MNLDQLQALVGVLEGIDPKVRREAVERAMLIMTGVATWGDIDSFSFDFKNTWNEPGRTWGDGGTWGGGKGTAE